MPNLSTLLVALALISSTAAFPLSALSGRAFGDVPIHGATQLISLHDGTYLGLISITGSAASLSLDPRILGRPFAKFDSENDFHATTEIVARLHPANSSVIWAYAISNMEGPAYAAVDDAHAIYVMGRALLPGQSFADAFRVLRFSADGEVVWEELYNGKSSGLAGLSVAGNDNLGGAPSLDLADSRTLAIPSFVESPGISDRITTVFVDTITRKARQVRLPIPGGPTEAILLRAVAADIGSGTACTAGVSVVQDSSGRVRLFVECANTTGGSEVVTRILVPFAAKTEYYSLRAIMVSGSEEEAAALYVVAIRGSGVESVSLFSEPTLSDQVTEMLLFKLDPTTLQDMEWGSSLISTKPTMRTLLLINPFGGYAGRIPSVEYIRDRDTLVVLYVSPIKRSGIETLPDGTIAFLGNSSEAAGLFPGRQWLLYFGNDLTPAAIRVPYDPRPDGEQDVFDLLDVSDLELSADKCELYLFGSLYTTLGIEIGSTDVFPIGAVDTVPFSLPGAGSGCAADAGVGDQLRDGVEESFEPDPDETAEPSMDGELESSPDILQEIDM